MVQHGEKVRSAGDPGLTEVGHRQAAAVATWLAENHTNIDAVIASPLRRAQATAAPIASALDLDVITQPAVRERMNWDSDASISLNEFLAEWQRATDDRGYQPEVGDSSIDAARFIDALLDLDRDDARVVVVVSHGGVTVDALRSIAGDASVSDASADLLTNGVPCCAITHLQVRSGAVTVIDYPSTLHLEQATQHRPA